jgi:UDP-2,4-diacetamido-2,4,6-trideoxy-beta-L-altropyranose hydrolase
MYSIGIRADAGKSIGMGHLIRCLSLAKELYANNFKIYFIIKNKLSKKIIDNKFETIELTCDDRELNNNEYDYGSRENLQEEYNQIDKIIKQYNLDILLIDSYNVNKDFLYNLQKNIKCLIYIDDVNKFKYPVDIIINGNITGTYYTYDKYFHNTLLLLGTKYNMIRDEFKDIKYKEPNRTINTVMITSGGSDPLNISKKVIRLLLDDKQLCNLEIKVVVNKSFIHLDELVQIREEYSNVSLVTNIKDSIINNKMDYLSMKEIMTSSDIAISSGGSTLYELCSCSIPTAAYILADNQEFIVNKLSSNNYIKSIGWYNRLEEKINSIKNLIMTYNDREALALKGKQLVDGKGTERIVKQIIEWMDRNV